MENYSVNLNISFGNVLIKLDDELKILGWQLVEYKRRRVQHLHPFSFESISLKPIRALLS